MVQVHLDRTAGSMDPSVGEFALSFQRLQPAAAPAPEQAAPLWAVLLKWAAILLAVLAVGVLVLRQLLLARYRKRKRLMARRRIMSAPPPQRPRPKVDRVIDVTLPRSSRNRIQVLPPEDR